MRLMRWMVLFTLLFSTVSFQATAQTRAYSDLAQYFDIYGLELPAELVEKMQTSYKPQKVNCGDVQISLNEVLYDGRWLYTSASIKPTIPDKILVMPGSSQMGDKVSGLYHENKRKDDRSFQKVADEEEKRLLSVYVYPKEFDQLPVYFIDHLQDVDERSIMFSGASLISSSEVLSFYWSVQIYEVDVKTGAYDFINEYEFPATIASVGSVIQKTYKLDTKEKLPFDLITLVHTPLSTYAYPIWRSEDDRSFFDFTLLDSNLDPIPKGVPADVNTYTINEPSNPIYLSLYRCDSGMWSEPLQLLSIEK